MGAPFEQGPVVPELAVSGHCLAALRDSAAPVTLCSHLT